MVRVLKQFSHKPLAYISDIEKTYFQTHVSRKSIKNFSNFYDERIVIYQTNHSTLKRMLLLLFLLSRATNDKFEKHDV